ncbi:heparanase-like [Ruditapes philippinarum]|uniref:heparanase-like n=1 Tax=Ruditapes philippinarum TaxID=129788 RepID=UPI00295B613D|nr:heparanase-like [Ruditapes philippinarum]
MILPSKAKMNFKFYFSIYIVIALMSCDTNCISVRIDTSKIHSTVNPKFVNVAVDSGLVKHHWENFQWNSTRVITLAAGLAPSFMRMGGTGADFLIFKNDKLSTSQGHRYDTQVKKTQQWLTKNTREIVQEIGIKGRTKRDVVHNDEPLVNFTMTASFYDQVHKFVSSAGWDLIFDLNSLLRKPDGVWDSTNAIELINYTVQSGYKMGGWELGNEPDEYTGAVIKHKLVPPEQLAKDYAHLRELVRRHPSFRNCVLMGPALASMTDYIKKGFFYSFECEPDEYTNYIIKHKLVPPEQLAKDFAHLKEIVRSHPSFRNCVIMGPSIAAMSVYWRKGFFYSFMSAGGGDAVTAATFHQYYEDGAIAKLEDFYNPDVLNILYGEIQTGVNLTRAAGSTANVWLGETSSAWRGGAKGLSDRYVAAFMWLDKLGMSARDGINALIRQTFYGGNYSLLDHETCDPHPDYWLTLLYKLLVGNKVLRVTSPDSRGKIRAYAHCTQTTKSPKDFAKKHTGGMFKFSLPGGNSILSKHVKLNGEKLQMVDDKTLPNLLRPVKTTSQVSIPAMSYSFIVLPDAQLPVCM